MARIAPITYVADFETTVYKGQQNTEVWSAGLLGFQDYAEPQIFNSIDGFFDYLFKARKNAKLYFHNLKFDGSFILCYLMDKLGFQEAFDVEAQELESRKKMPRKSFTHCISDVGQWYSILIKTARGNYIEIHDSMKLLPFSLKRIGQAFRTKHQKLEMEYIGRRRAFGVISEQERKYLENDLYVLKEALEFLFKDGHDKSTIGSCCLAEYKKILGGEENYRILFPDLDEIPLPDFITEKEEWCNSKRVETADGYIRQSYRGGWTFVLKEKVKKMFLHGITLDVNSLYPSVMYSKSGNYYPIGKPTFFDGRPPEWLKEKKDFWYIRFSCRFRIKPKHLPIVQIKNKPELYGATQYLETSNFIDENGQECRYYQDKDGNVKECRCVFMMTHFEFELFKEHYHVYDLVYLDGCYFNCEKGLFDGYIKKYKKIKQESTGALRELAKLFLNNLYGKFSASNESSYKTVKTENGVLKFTTHESYTKESGYIAVGSAITSYARCFTIRAAQKNYDGFIYADTDSLHLHIPIEKVQGCELHDSDFLKWKHEASWEKGWFVRQKTYIEVENGKYNIKACGMSAQSKKVFLIGMKPKEERPNYYEGLSEYSKEWLNNLEEQFTIESFDTGLEVAGRLLPKQIQGGILLTEGNFRMLA